MKLLFDQNLSPRLVDALEALFPGSRHVRQEGLEAGSKPHVIWIRRGNCSTSQVEQLLRANAARIGELDQQIDAGFLVLL